SINPDNRLSTSIQILKIVAGMEINFKLSELDINKDLNIGISDALLSLKEVLMKNNNSLPPKNCKEILDNVLSNASGFYYIDPDGLGEPFQVYCDMDTVGGGWTFLQGSIAENSYNSIQNACPANTTPFELKSVNHAMALENYVKNIANDGWYLANAFSGPNISGTCESEHIDVEVGYLTNENSWENSNIDESSFGINSSNNCNLNIYDPIPINHTSGLTNRSENNFFYNNTEQVEKGIVICSTNDIDTYTELSNAFTITTYPASDFTNDTLAMNNKFGINNYIIEDFEDVNLVEDLSIQVGNNPPFTELPQVYDPSTWGHSAWDGQYVVLNSTDNAFNLPQTNFKSRITFFVEGGTTSLGIGLSNFQRGATQNHPILINGKLFIDNIGSLTNYTDYIDKNSAKNCYLRIDADPEERIESITFGYDGTNVDGLMFDHLAFKNTDEIFKGLVAYYPFNGNANDESGNGNDGEVHGAALTEDRFGNLNKAFVFDGDNDYINVKDSSSLDISSTITISCWIKTKGSASYSGIINKVDEGDSNRNGYIVTINSKFIIHSQRIISEV
ncbi:protein containing Fibrinogen, alpha/beta/gamma chain, partial [Candidatus Magnetomorum sp. HK-1]